MKTVTKEQATTIIGFDPGGFGSKESLSLDEFVTAHMHNLDKVKILSKLFMTEEQCRKIAEQEIKKACSRLEKDITANDICKEALKPGMSFFYEGVLENKGVPFILAKMLEIVQIGKLIMDKPVDNFDLLASLMAKNWRGLDHEAAIQRVLDIIDPKPLIDTTGSLSQKVLDKKKPPAKKAEKKLKRSLT